MFGFLDAIAGAVTAEHDRWGGHARENESRAAARHKGPWWAAGHAGATAAIRNSHGPNCQCHEHGTRRRGLGW